MTARLSGLREDTDDSEMIQLLSRRCPHHYLPLALFSIAVTLLKGLMTRLMLAQPHWCPRISEAQDVGSLTRS